MTPLRTFFRRLLSLGRCRAVKSEIDEELRFHLQQRTAENIAAGMSPDEAARGARKRFGNLQAVRVESLEIRGVAWLDNFVQDLSFGLRLWRKQPGSLLSAIAALTLGIGLVTFSLCAINCVFFAKLPFPGSDRLVYTTIPGQALSVFEERQSTFDALSQFVSTSANITASGAPFRAMACRIAPNFLDVIRAAPLSGRAFAAHDASPEADPVALIGFDVWQREFQGSSAALGSVIRVDGRPRTIVGIMPPGFQFPIDNELWIPTEPGSAEMSGFGFVFGRLKKSASIAGARAELNLIANGFAGPPRPGSGREAIMVGPFTRFIEMKGAYGPAPAMYALLTVTLLVLFIACANVAGLNLANAAKRGTELAVRGALGATRKRLVSQMLVESLILTVCGAVGGLIVIGFLCNWLANWMEANKAELSDVPFWMHLKIDGRLLLGLIGLVLFTNLLAGLWPALQATRRDVNDLLKARAVGTPGRRTARFRWLLITVQIAFSVVVLTQSLVLLDFSRRLIVHLPFDPADVLTARVDLPPSVDAPALMQRLEHDLPGSAGVRAVAFSTSGPDLGHPIRQIEIEGAPARQPPASPSAHVEAVSTGYFSALNIHLFAGRAFTSNDVTGSAPVAIVNSDFASTFFGSDNPLGRRFREGTDAWLTVVGCTPDLRFDPSEQIQEPLYYVPLGQHPAKSVIFLLPGGGRTADSASAVLRSEMARLIPNSPVYRVATMRQLMDHQIIGYYLGGLLLGVCSLGSLFLATLGIFGLVSLSVTQRTREIGIRVALGATQARIIITLLRQSAWQIAGGLAVGLVLALALNHMLTHSIADYPTVPHSLVVFLAAAACLGAVSLIAILIPSIRGSKIQPMAALRYE